MPNFEAVAAWHADKAMQAYLSGDLDLYCHHIAIADRLRRTA